MLSASLWKVRGIAPRSTRTIGLHALATLVVPSMPQGRASQTCLLDLSHNRLFGVAAVNLGLGRIVVLCYYSSNLYQIY